MIIVIIMLVLALGVLLGYAARQRQDLEEHADRIERLLLENEGLRCDNRAHETSLTMVLGELDRA